MTSPDSPQGAPEAAPAHSRRRPLKTLFIILALIILGVVTLVSIWTARRYQQAVELAKRTREQYGTLNTSYAFTPPLPGRLPPAGRWQAMLRVRGELQRQTPPGLLQRLDSLLQARSLRDPAVYHALLEGVPQLGELLTAQINALRREQMSSHEYQWMLGLGIVKVMESSAKSPSSDGTWQTLEQLERLTHADTDQGNDLDAQTVLEYLREKYRGAAEPSPEVLATLRERGEAACAIDLALVMLQWTAPAEKAPEGLLRKLLPRN
jgi:hypothetical protein